MHTCFRIFMTFKRLASKLLALICEYLRVQSSNTVLFLKLTCSTFQSAVILDSSIILICISLQTSLSNLHSSKLTSLCERAKHPEARHHGAYVRLKYVIQNFSATLMITYTCVFTITIKLSLYNCVLHSLLYTAEATTVQVYEYWSLFLSNSS